jgi:hypothetical protein
VSESDYIITSDWNNEMLSEVPATDETRQAALENAWGDALIGVTLDMQLDSFNDIQAMLDELEEDYRS